MIEMGKTENFKIKVKSEDGRELSIVGKNCKITGHTQDTKKGKIVSKVEKIKCDSFELQDEENVKEISGKITEIKEIGEENK